MKFSINIPTYVFHRGVTELITPVIASSMILSLCIYVMYGKGVLVNDELVHKYLKETGYVPTYLEKFERRLEIIKLGERLTELRSREVKTLAEAEELISVANTIDAADSVLTFCDLLVESVNRYYFRLCNDETYMPELTAFLHSNNVRNIFISDINEIEYTYVVDVEITG